MLSIRQIISQVHGGHLRIPAFQYGFVWDPESMAFLMDRNNHYGDPRGSGGAEDVAALRQRGKARW